MKQYKYPFFNTIELKDDELKEKLHNAITQNERVYLIYKIRGIAMSPVDVHKIYCDLYRVSQRSPYNVPLTSIRRAITTLTNEGLLEKTSIKADGAFGMKNFKWIIK